MTLNSVTVSPLNSGGLFGVNCWVQAATRVRVRFSASNVTLSDGESITGYSFSFKGATYTANSSGLATSSTAVKSGENEIVCYVHGTNSDGETISASLTYTINAYSYDPPTGQYVVTRCNASGTATDSGTYLKITPTLTISTCGGANTGTSTVQYKLRSDTSYSEAGSTTGDTPLIFGGGAILSQRSYDILITLTDTAGFSREYSLICYSNYWAMRFSSDGKGVAFGKSSATSGYMELASGMSFKMGSTAMTEAQLSALLNPTATAGVTMSLLWTNGSPAANFAAQTVSLSLSSYKLVLVQFKETTSLALYHWAIGMMDGLELVCSMGSKTGTNYDYKRSMICSGTGIEFSTGYRNGTAGASYMVPYKVYGVKW